ncbi:MAG: 3'-5' exoribonuclease [Telluria sp.]|nr:3'-5' exoribonuclease [Telluria sp.]
MLIFLDTEFTDFIDCDLVSIGMITEDGQSFYAERTDFNYDWCNDFVRSAVWAHLGADPNAKVKRDELRERLVSWFKTLPASVQVAADSFTDWELLIDALDGQKPENLTGYVDLRPLGESKVFNEAVCAHHAVPGRPWHHAYYDAAATRMGWLAQVAADSAGSQG